NKATMVKAFHRSLEAKLATLKDPEYDESDGDENEDDQPQTTISSKRTAAASAAGKGTKRKKKQSTKANNDDDDESPSTVIYLGHLPVGFEEREITTFLNQFGSVKRCRVSRSTKTGRSRGYAFVDFIDPEVTQIVAETMSGYFLLEKRLVCHVLPNDKVHELMFAKPKKVPTKAEKQKKARLEVNQRRSADVMKEITAKLVKREEMKRKKLVELGIDYEFPGYKASAEVVAGSSSSSSSSAAAGDKSNKKKKRKLSGDENEEVVKDDTHKNNNEAEKTTPRSQKKSSKKKKRASSVDQEEEKENDADAAAAVTEEEPPSKKKKKSGKTPKKQKTQKNK
ncbi:hypothetical protein ACHAXR_002352, partial [Thalassiosira sp. AJA248-18]